MTCPPAALAEGKCRREDEKLNMKKLLILIINFYQSFISVILKNILGIDKMCKFSPTCSEYTKQMVKQHGFFGILLGAKRIGRCL